MSTWVAKESTERIVDQLLPDNLIGSAGVPSENIGPRHMCCHKSLTIQSERGESRVADSLLLAGQTGACMTRRDCLCFRGQSRNHRHEWLPIPGCWPVF